MDASLPIDVDGSSGLSHRRDRIVTADPARTVLPRPAPLLVTLPGRTVLMEPLDAERDAPDLYPLLHGDADREAVWEYLPYGPYWSPEDFAAELKAREASLDPLWFALRSIRRDRVEGLATLMEIRPEAGVAEIGHICLSTAVQNSVEATEGLYLLMRHILHDLGYRRLEWKCNALNRSSRRAAGRLGFSFEGIFFQHMVVKGHNRDTAWFSILDTEWPRIDANFRRWLDPSTFDDRGRQSISLGTMNRSIV